MKKLLLLSSIAITLSSCNNFNWNIKPSGQIINDTVSVSKYVTLLNNSSANIELDKNIDPNKIVIIGDKNFIENLNIESNNNELSISNTKDVSFNTRNSPLIIKINNPNLQKAMIAGSGSIATNNVTITSDIDFNISGAGTIDVDVNNSNTNIYVSGSGSIFLNGKSDQLKASMSGAGNLNAEKLQNTTATIEISGAGNAKVNTSEELSVRISGVGNLNYKNYNNLKINKQISGIGSITEY